MLRTSHVVVMVSLGVVGVACGKALDGTCEESNNCVDTLSEAGGPDATSDVQIVEADAGRDSTVDTGSDDDAGDSSIPDTATDTNFNFPEASIDVFVPDGCTTEQPGDGIFVSAGGGVPPTCGSIGSPCAKIQDGLTLAQSEGKSFVYVAGPVGGAPYVESLTLKSAVTIQGGWFYNGGAAWARNCTGDPTAETIIQAPATSNTTIATNGMTATLDTLRVYSKSSANPGESLYGIFANAGSSLTLTNVVIQVAAGGAGSAGSAGTAGTGTVACANGTATPGGAGTAGAAGAAGTFTAAGYQAGGAGGTGGVGSVGTGSGAGGAGTAATCSDCVEDDPCSDCVPPRGATCQADVATSGTGGPGTSGTCGNPGSGGTGGTGGGSSIGVFVAGATLKITGGEITAGPGGIGGAGGTAGSGSAGAAGAVGTPGCENGTCGGTGTVKFCQETPGGGGGAGGSAGGAGGVGGRGGGGAGGNSYCYYVEAVADGGAVSVSGTTLQPASAGAAGGVGGHNGPNGVAAVHN